MRILALGGGLGGGTIVLTAGVVPSAVARASQSSAPAGGNVLESDARPLIDSTRGACK
jgi:hypothetical protein